ncbi:MAG: hypothetical protein AAGA16_07585 [Cyanobacteria bacterium P01_E01_bin.35]
MSSPDVEFFQSFCRRYINKGVNNHFRDISGSDDDSLSISVPRQVIKRICLHKDTDPIMLTVGRLLVWWVEARGLFNDIIYGIPSTEFDIAHTYYPQVKLHFKENRYDSSNNNRRPVRSEVSFRWREEDYTSTNINQLATKINADFGVPIFTFDKGRQLWTYRDKKLGYKFQVYVQSETEAKKIIAQAIGIQDEGVPDWTKNLRESKDSVNYNNRETVRVMGETLVKPRKRPVGTVRFTHAEMFIPGTTKPIILVDKSGYHPGALIYG